MLSNFKSFAFSCAVLLSVGAFTAPAMAGSIVADTVSGLVPNAFSTVTVNAADFQGPTTAANAINLAPIDLMVSTSNSFDVATSIILQLSNNAAISNSNGINITSSLAFASRNDDGSVGIFHHGQNSTIQILPDKIIIMSGAEEAPWSFFKLDGLILTGASALGTPGTEITMDGVIRNQSNTVLFENISATTLVTSADVPAPGALLLLGAGLAGLGGMRRKNKTA